MRVAPITVQLPLPDLEASDGKDRWWSLPEAARGEVMHLLAVLIVRGVLIESETDPLGPDEAAAWNGEAGDE